MRLSYKQKKLRQAEEMILEKIKEPKDLRRLSKKELDILAGEIRKFIIEKTSRTPEDLVLQCKITFNDIPKSKIMRNLSFSWS